MELCNKTIAQSLHEKAAEHPDKEAYVFDGISYAWKDVDRISDAMAASFYGRGVRKGMRVGIWGVNTIAWACSYFALQKLGAVAVLFNYSLKAMELGPLINQVEIRYLLIGEAKAGLDYDYIYSLMAPKFKTVKESWHIEKEFKELEKTEVKDEEKALLANIQCDIDCHDSCTIIFTSGTTAMAKGVLLSHYGIINDARAIAKGMHWTQRDKMLIAMPMFHCSGLTCALILSMCAGISAVIVRKFSPVEVMASIEKYRCTVFNAVPSMLLILKDHPDREKYDLSSFYSGTMGGSKISRDDFEAVCNTFHLTNYLSVYGQTECSPIVCMGMYGDPIDVTVSTIGKPLEGVSMRIWHCRENREAAVGEQGEIQVKTFSVMNGYYNRPEYDGKKFTADGWLHTGDMGFRDEKGYYHFICRADDMIIRSGENISPTEIEDCIHHATPAISMVKVVGVDAPIVQEEVAAFVKAIRPIDPEKLRRYVATYLANFKVPKYVFQLEDFPMTASGKIDDKRLKAMAREMVDELNSKNEDKGECCGNS